MPRPAPDGAARRARLSFPGVAIAVVVSCALLMPDGERAQPMGSSKPTVRWTKAERTLMKLVGKARARRGLRALEWRRTVGHVARRHSARMRDERAVYHGRLERMLADFDWELAADAVGCSPKVHKVFKGFMRSDPHRRLLLHKDWKRMGVGIRHRNGRIWVTVLFLD